MPEHISLPPNKAVELRSSELANEYADLHASTVADFLKPYVYPNGPPNISQSSAAKIVKSEHQEARVKFWTERYAGMHNDLESTVAHGVTALIFCAAVAQVEKVFPEDARTTEMPVLEALGHQSGGQEILSLRFPEGYFRIPEEVVVPVVDFYPTGTRPQPTPPEMPPRRGPVEKMPWVIPNQADKPVEQRVLCLPQIQVVRIHADGGELWQNPNFTPLGIPVTVA